MSRVFGIGIDLVELKSFRRTLNIDAAAFCDGILSEVEAGEFPSQKRQELYLARLFATKEAVLKAIGTGFAEDIGFTDMTVRNVMGDSPTVSISEEASAFLGAIDEIVIASSHNRNYVVSMVCIIDSR